MKRLLPLALLILPLAGCSGSGEATKEESASAQNNFTRPLTPAESSKLNAPATTPDKKKL